MNHLHVICHFRKPKVAQLQWWTQVVAEAQLLYNTSVIRLNPSTAKLPLLNSSARLLTSQLHKGFSYNRASSNTFYPTPRVLVTTRFMHSCQQKFMYMVRKHKSSKSRAKCLKLYKEKKKNHNDVHDRKWTIDSEKGCNERQGEMEEPTQYNTVVISEDDMLCILTAKEKEPWCLNGKIESLFLGLSITTCLHAPRPFFSSLYWASRQSSFLSPTPVPLSSPSTLPLLKALRYKDWEINRDVESQHKC